MTGERFSVSRAALLSLALSYTFDPTGLFMTWLGAVILHELAHVLFLHLCGGRIVSLSIRLFGAELREAPRQHPALWRKILPVAAGPLVNLLAAYLFARLGWYSPAGVHCLTGLTNLLPFPGLDGGRLLRLCFDAIYDRMAPMVRRSRSGKS